MNTPAKYSSHMNPGTPEEYKAALKALFVSFPAQEGIAVAGYIEVVQSEPVWAVTMAVRKFIKGEYPTHSGKWLPTPAELAKAVRSETAWRRDRNRCRQQIADAQQDAMLPPLTPQQIERRRRQIADLQGLIWTGPNGPGVDWKDCPKYLGFRELAANSRGKRQ